VHSQNDRCYKCKTIRVPIPKVYFLTPFQRHVVIIVDFIDGNRFLEC